MKLNKNILLVVAEVFSLILLLGVGFMLYLGVSKFGGEKRKLEDSKNQRKMIYKSDPFPSPGNIKKEQHNKRVIEKEAQDLVDILSGSQISQDAGKSPTMFMTMFSEKKNGLVKKARTNNISIPENFAFGFDRYSKEGKPPAPDDVPRLVQQLVSIEMLSDIILDEKVDSISEVSRDQFEAKVLQKKPKHSGGGRRVLGTRAAASKGNALTKHVYIDKTAGLFKKGDLYTTLHYVFVFDCKEDKALSIINKITESKTFMVVTSVSFEKHSEDVLTPPEKGKVEKVNGSYPSRVERMVSGKTSAKDLEIPVAVTLDVDVYTFRKVSK